MTKDTKVGQSYVSACFDNMPTLKRYYMLSFYNYGGIEWLLGYSSFAKPTSTPKTEEVQIM